MFLLNLQLINYRNLPQVNLSFSQLNLLLGNNAQGKSNLLESIYFLATTKSPKAVRDSQLIEYGKIFSKVSGEVDQARLGKETQKETPEIVKLEINMQKKPAGENEETNGLEKRVKVNGVGRRAVDYIGNLVVVSFAPEDINLVSGPPALRRWYIDLSLAQIDSLYKKAVSNYSAVLIARNRILKRIKERQAKIDELDFWTDQLLDLGQIISQKREQYFKALNQEIEALSFDQDGHKKLFLNYQANVISSQRLQQYLDKEIAAGISLIGPQRDDFLFELGGHNLAYFGSRGEQRTAVLELKLAELRYIENSINTLPVLILDDVFSELDEAHRQYVVSKSFEQQTIISAIETENIPSSLEKEARIIKVEKGVALAS